MSLVGHVPLSKLLGAILLVTGACVGGGMLALPVEMGVSGFFPSLFIMLLSWGFMTLTGLLIVEVNLWMEEGAHILTMATRFLGLPGKIVSAILFLFIGYASLIAYNAAGADLIIVAFNGITGVTLTYLQACVLFALLFGSMISLGTHVIGRINSLLVVGMVLAYFFMLGLGLPEMDPQNLSPAEWKQSFWGLPLVFSTFSFQMIIPSLTPYLQRNAVAMRRCVIWGTTIPLVVYSVWQAIVLSIVPQEGVFGLASALSEGKAATWSLRHFVDTPLLSMSADFFAFFALVTSYLAFTLGTSDFIADSFKIPSDRFGKLFVGVLVVIPVLLFSVSYPNAFIEALNLTGGFGDTILNGLIPVGMIWVGRYTMRMEGPYRVRGGKPLLALLTGFALLVIYYQVASLL